MAQRAQKKYQLNLLFLLVNFFIRIGYIAKLIIQLPFRALSLGSKKLGLYKIKRPQIKISKVKPPTIRIKTPQIRKIHFPFTFPKFLRFKRPSLSLPQIPGLSHYSPFLFKSKYFIFGIFFATLIVGINQGFVFVKELPSPRSIGKVNFAKSTHILDRNGKLLYEIYREQNRTPIKLADLPPHIYQATIAFEDKDFFHHNGVSIAGALRASREIYFNKNLQGGSTITQQLVKSALLTPERTIQRKIKEVILAIWTERLYTKKEILQMYLNQVPYGGSSYGIEEAAQTYFGHHARELTLDEAALLAGLPQAPSIYTPFVNPELALKRRNEILKKNARAKVYH